MGEIDRGQGVPTAVMDSQNSMPDAGLKGHGGIWQAFAAMDRNGAARVFVSYEKDRPCNAVGRAGKRFTPGDPGYLKNTRLEFGAAVARRFVWTACLSPKV